MSYRICIPCAGTGSRLGGLTRFLNKSLVSIAHRPALSHVIDQFPSDAEFVIALGYKGHLVREFLELAYPDRRFFFVAVEPFEGAGSGLGLSLLACKTYLEQPFVFVSCDTLVKGDIPEPSKNWMGYAEVDDIAEYRTLAVEYGHVTRIIEKGEGDAGVNKPYIGMAGICDHDIFWSNMVSGGEAAILSGEAHGLRPLLRLKVEARCFNWFDTGSPESLARTRDAYEEDDGPNILDKANEAIWFVGDQVIKFSDDRSFIANRAERANELRGFVPTITGVRTQMYCYKKADGDVLSKVITLPLFNRLLECSQKFCHHLKLDRACFD